MKDRYIGSLIDDIVTLKHTAVEMVAEGAMEIVEFKEVVLDRPFVYMLIDCETNLPFFIGTMMNVNGD